MVKPFKKQKKSGKKGSFLKRKKPAKKPVEPESSNSEPTAPRITTDTVAEHREEVLAGARRFIYPLQQSRNRIVIVSSLIIIGVFLSATIFSGLLLYRYQSTSSFAYRVSQIVPFPITKIDGSYVAYENYLFELNYSLFYYETYEQEGVDINSSEGEQVIKRLKERALLKVKLDTIAKQLAEEQGIEVTEDQISRQIDLIRNQGGIGSSDEVLNDILASSYNWDINDLRRTIRLQLTRQSLPRVLDTETVTAADAALAELNGGAEFGAVALKYSEDLATKDNDGVIGDISRTDANLPPEFIEAAFGLEVGQTSEIVESRFGLHIIKLNSVEGDVRNVSHVLLTYFNVEEFLQEKLTEAEISDYITIE